MRTLQVVRNFLLLAALSLAMMGASRAYAVDAKELTLTAAFLYNFAKYTEWPEDTFVDGGAFVLCYPEGDPIGPYMSRLASRSLRNKPITVRAVRSSADFSGCHLLYFEHEHGLFEQVEVASLRALVVGRNIDGVDISLFRIGENLRFKIKQSRALEHGIKFRSQLLKIAAETD